MLMISSLNIKDSTSANIHELGSLRSRKREDFLCIYSLTVKFKIFFKTVSFFSKTHGEGKEIGDLGWTSGIMRQ